MASRQKCRAEVEKKGQGQSYRAGKLPCGSPEVIEQMRPPRERVK